jgi:UDP-glucose 4-epimerase
VATILVSGIVGGLAQRVAAQLLQAGHSVVGVDYRKVDGVLPGSLSGLKVYRANYNKTIIEDVFRHHSFDAVLHLGRVGNLKESEGKRFDLNVVGSQKIMNLCVQHGVKRLVVLSTFHIYGAHPANHIPIAEDEPLRAGLQFPQIADAIQVKTVVLRPTNIIGPTLHNTMSQFLRLPRAPYLLGFNPMSQFVHEDDMAAAVVAATESEVTGIYNIAGPEVVPWRTALELARAVQFPITEGLASLFMRATGNFPQYLINFFRYPCVISDRAFRSGTGWAPRVDIEQTVWTTVSRARGLS